MKTQFKPLAKDALLSGCYFSIYINELFAYYAVFSQLLAKYCHTRADMQRFFSP